MTLSTVSGLRSLVRCGVVLGMLLAFAAPLAHAQTSVTNAVNVSAPSGVTDPTPNNVAFDTDAVTPVAGLRIAKTDNDASATPGSTIVYTITVTNDGPSTAVNTVVSDATPAGLTFTSNTGDCTTAYPCNLGDVPSGQSRTITTTYTVPAGYSGADPISNTASVSSDTPDSDTANNSATDTTPVSRSAKLAITKTSSPNPATPGQAITYTITVSNAGPSTAFNATVTDDLPDSLTNASWSCSAAGSSACDAASGSGDISTTADVAPDGNVTYTVTATIAPDATGTVTNTATVAPPAGTTDPDGGGSATDSNSLSPSADMAAAVSGFPANATAGTIVTGTVTCTNNGPSTAINATCDVTGLPAGATVTCAPTPPATLSPGDDIVCDISYAAPGTGSVTVTGTAGSDTADPDATNDVANAVTQIDESSDIAVAKALDTVGPYTIGQAIQYTITVHNDGPSDATNIAVDDTATNLTITNVTGACTALDCTIANLGAGADATITVSATINAAGAFDNAVTVDAEQNDPDTGDNSDSTGNGGNAIEVVADDDSATTFEDTSVTIDVIDGDVANGSTLDPASLTITTNPTNGSVGCDGSGNCTYTPNPGFSGIDTFVYRICDVSSPTPVCDTATVTLSVSAVNDVPDAVNDDLGAINEDTPVTTAAATLLGNDTDADGDALTITSVQAATNGTVVLNGDGSVTFTPTPGYSGPASYSYTISDGNGGTDTATVTITVLGIELSVAKAQPINDDRDGSGTVTIGDVLTYTITATNGGQVDLTNVVVTDAMLTPGSITCAALAPGQTCVLTGTHTVTADDVNAGNVTNTATADSDQTAPVNSNTVTTQTANRAIAATSDSGSAVGASGGTAIANVLANDTLNGQPTTLASVTLAQVSTSNPNVALDPSTGAVNVAPGIPAGTYTLVYRICEQANPANCATATVTVTVTAAPIDAVDDTVPTPVNGTTGGQGVINVLDNDTLNGVAINPADVNLAPVTNGPLTINADGTLDVAPNTPAGTYTVSYQICEALNPANCDTATATVTVTAPGITASNDTPATGSTSQNTPVTTNVLANDTLNGAPISPNDVTVAVTVPPSSGTATVNPDGAITFTPATNFSGTVTYSYTVCEKLNPANCATATVTITVASNVVTPTSDTATTQAGEPVTINVLANDSTTGAPLDPASLSIVTPPANGTVTCIAGVCTYTPRPGFSGTDTFTYRVCDLSNPVPVCVTGTATVIVSGEAQLRLVKQAATRSVRPGELVRYTVIAENVGDAAAVNASLVDTPPAGFTYVDGSLAVDDDNDAGALSGTSPLRISGIDVAAGGRATIVYFLRAGAGIGHGVHRNSVSALGADGAPISNVASAEVEYAGDPMLDDSLIVGSVFDDRDGDGWQDPADASGVRVQGGFVPGAYIANSTTVDRGNGPQPEADASSPLLHGIALGTIAGRNSTAATPATAVIRQKLRSPDFSNDFVLVTGEGTTVRMNTAGESTVERNSGDAAKGLTAQEIEVRRDVSQVADGYEVTYTIRNTGIAERGIPGVRIASVEGLIMETDAYGRYHLEGVPGGDASRGRNFILKVDPATLPPGSQFTTGNPRVRRITPGLPARFDFGVKLPAADLGPATQHKEVELGEVLFDAGSANVKPDYAPLFATIAGKLRDSDGGNVVITAQAEQEALAFARASAVQSALNRQLEPELAAKVKVDVVAQASTAPLLSLGNAIELGTMLFDTDKATIKPQYRSLISAIAAELNRDGHGVIGIIGHADSRGPSDYNVQLGMRRAKAVFDAIAAELTPEVRQNVRVDITEDPSAAGVGER